AGPSPPRSGRCPPRRGGRFRPPDLAAAGGRGQQSEMGLPLPPTPLRGGPFPPRFAPGDKAPGDKAPGDKGVGRLCPPRSGGRFLPPELAEAGGRGQQSEMGLPLPPTPLRGGPFPPRFAPGDKAPGDKAPGDKGVGRLCPPRSGGRFLPPELAEAGGRGQQSEMGSPLPPTPLRGGPFPP